MHPSVRVSSTMSAEYRVSCEESSWVDKLGGSPTVDTRSIRDQSYRGCSGKLLSVGLCRPKAEVGCQSQPGLGLPSFHGSSFSFRILRNSYVTEDDMLTFLLLMKLKQSFENRSLKRKGFLTGESIAEGSFHFERLVHCQRVQ